MNFILVGLVFLVGASVGSFVNVLISRSVSGQGWVRGRSKCDHCQTPLPWYSLLPIVSYLIQRGLSRCCHRKLSWVHPVIEALFGALFVWWLLVGFLFFRLATAPGIYLQPIFWLGIGVMLLIIAIADGLYQVILMPIVYLAACWIYGYRLILLLAGTYQLSDLGLSLLSGAGSALFLWGLHKLTRGRGMGDGDPYLAFVTGSLIPGILAYYGMLAAFMSGAIVGVGLLLSGQKKLKAKIAFGPFLVFGAGVVLLISRYVSWW